MLALLGAHSASCQVPPTSGTPESQTFQLELIHSSGPAKFLYTLLWRPPLALLSLRGMKSTRSGGHQQEPYVNEARANSRDIEAGRQHDETDQASISCWVPSLKRMRETRRPARSANPRLAMALKFIQTIARYRSELYSFSFWSTVIGIPLLLFFMSYSAPFI